LSSQAANNAPSGVEGDGLEALAFGVAGNRSKRREGQAAIARTGVEDLSVEGAVLEDCEGDRNTSVLVDGDLRPLVGAGVEAQRFRVDGNRRREAAAEVGRMRDGDPSGGRPDEPKASVPREGWRRGPRTTKRWLGA
jgi:hypothetical protein